MSVRIIFIVILRETYTSIGLNGNVAFFAPRFVFAFDTNGGKFTKIILPRDLYFNFTKMGAF